MTKKSFILILLLVAAFGCANQQKGADVDVEEISLAVTGLA